MTRTFLFLVCFLVATNGFSQNWESSFQEAKETAAEKNKPLLLVFSGSDWCIPCMKLEKDIWESESFKDFALKDLVLYRADFPQKKKNKLSENLAGSNKKLAEKYNTKGYFPLVVLLNPSGKVLGQMGYEKIGPQQYIEKIAALYP